MKTERRLRGFAATNRRAMDGRGTALRLFLLAARDRRRLALAVLVAIAVAAGSALPSALLGRAVDQFIARADAGGLARTMLLLVGVYVLAYGARVAQGMLMGRLGQQAVFAMRSELFAALQRQSLSFFDRHESGDLQSRLINDQANVNSTLGTVLMQATLTVVSTVGVLVGMFALNWELALSSLIVLPIMFVANSLYSGPVLRKLGKGRVAIGQVSANVHEDLAGIKVVQAFNRGEINRDRFARRNRANRDANLEARLASSVYLPTMSVLSAVAIGVVAGFGGYLVINHAVTVGVVVAFLGYVYQLYGPIQQLGPQLASFQQALVAAERVFELVDEPVDLREPAAPVRLGRIAGTVTLENVSFGYKPGQTVLRGIDLVAEPGSTIALVGPTGAGKTTIVNLLARFYDVTGGRVTVDGVDVRDVTSSELRSQLGIVPQHGFLFAGSIRENIRYGRPEAGDPEVEEAARVARADEFIARLPQGYDTPVGEGGRQLSHGQRQLLAFARAILANPRILILDEATSSVDPHTESLIQQALAELLRDRTSFVIAHRLSTVRAAKLILVVEDGEIVERGSHEELLRRDGRYASLYRRQTEGEAVREVEVATRSV
jgi:ATP-binding cassette, subfamily B, multidrug efflux pump